MVGENYAKGSTLHHKKGYKSYMPGGQGSIKEQMPDAAIPLSLTSYSFMKYRVLSV